MTAALAVRPEDLSPFVRYSAWPHLLVRDGHVWTMREDDDDATIVQMPLKPHIYHLIRLWTGDHQVLEEHPEWDFRFQAVKKARRMMATWVYSALCVWDASTNEAAVNGVGSRKFDAADWILKRRMAFIYERLPASVFDGRKPVMKMREGMIEFPEIGSQIIAFPQGRDAWRQYTFRNVMLDEVAFWEQFIETYSGLRPAARRVTMFSSPEEGSGFKRVFQDARLNQKPD